jgi:hypothetical protein
MPEHDSNGGDVFYVIGFTEQDIVKGALSRTMQLSTEILKMMAALHQQYGPLAQAANRGSMVKKLVEIYCLDAFIGSGEDDTFAQRFGRKYQLVDFYNETAFSLSNQCHIQLPAVIGKLTRAELPKHVGIGMRSECFTLALTVNLDARIQARPRQVYVAPFFLRSAHLFFINSDNRLRPAALIRWRFRCPDAPLLARSFVTGVAFLPSSTAMALSRRFRSAFNSLTMPWVFNIPPVQLNWRAVIVADLARTRADNFRSTCWWHRPKLRSLLGQESLLLSGHFLRHREQELSVAGLHTAKEKPEALECAPISTRAAPRELCGLPLGNFG